MKRFIAITIFIVVFVFAAIAQEELSVERIMQDPDLSVGSLPEAVSWNLDGSGLTFQWNPENDTLTGFYNYSLKRRELNKLSIREREAIVNRIIFSDDREMGFYVDKGAIYKYNFKKNTKEKLIHLDERITNLKIISDNYISFLLGDKIYDMNCDEKLLTPVIRFADAKHTSSSNDQEKVLINQQKEIFKVISDRMEVREAKSAASEQVKSNIPTEIEKPKGSIDDCSIDSKRKYASLLMYEPAKGSSKTKVPHFVTETGYVEVHSAREKVGDIQGQKSMHVINLQTSEIIAINTSKLEGIKDQPTYFSDYPERIISGDEDKKERKVNVTDAMWSADGKYLVANILSDDNKDRWIVLVNPENGELTLLDRQHDDAWIGGPGIGGWSFWTGTWGWMPDGESLWFQSEASGFSHLYSVNVSTRKKRQITKGDFEIYQPHLSTRNNCFYLTANKGDWGQRHFYRINTDGSNMVQLTSMEGNNEVKMSYDEKYLAIRNSYANKPWELYWQKNKPGSEAIQITYSPSSYFKAYVWRVPEFVSFKASDGTMVPARLYKPENVIKGGPAVIFVHGAGYLQNAHKWWSSYFREYMFHNLLVDKGYTVLDIDYRGSAGYGRDWRTAIYRHMGGKDLSDQVDGANYLVEKHQVAKERIGIYGGSYGGFITLMAMFNYPDVFKAGAALRSVTDWAHYNHGYTENILNTPALDSLAYRRSSPIYFAEGLKGALLMCHGLVDDNVQFQDIVRLSQRLIELGKENWELAVYPVEPHGFVEPSSWIDEYKRILKLFEENLK